MSIELLSTEVKPGHCVIINDCDNPGSRHVAVVTVVQPGMVRAVYLCAAIHMTECATTHPAEVMPLSRFGVRVVLCECSESYRCEPDKALPLTAVYPDGKTRQWQEHHTPPPFQVLKPTVRLIALKAWHESRKE